MFLKTISVFVTVLICFIYSFSAVASALEVTAQSSVLMCADSGQILYQKNADQSLSMASTTKIMTAVLALESSCFDSVLTVGKEVEGVEGSSLGLRTGDRITMYDLVTGMMLASGNDAANAVAVAVSGSVDAFVALMNAKASEIGMLNTHFLTPSGLDGESHYSTAADMAVLAGYAIRNPLFAEICSKYNAKISVNGKTVWLQNHNRLLKEYKGLIGIKTGFTKKSGRCLVTAAQRDGKTLVAVTLNAPDDWNDHKKLLDYGFAKTQQICVVAAGTTQTVSVVGGVSNKAVCKTLYDLSYTASELLAEIETVTILQPFIYAPAKKGDIVGYMILRRDAEIIAQTPLVLAEDTAAHYAENKEEKSFSEKLFHFLNGWLTNG